MIKFFIIIFISAYSLLISSCSNVSRPSEAAKSSWAVQRNIANENLDVPWAYDPGPNPNDKMGKELIDIVASQPNMPLISKQLTGEQLFRPAFGPTLWRMIQVPNTVKILFIGQDGTHIAEAAGRTATAGFGGRAQDLAAYFGVNSGAAFINTFAYTIRGQYTVFSVPVFGEKNGVPAILNYNSNSKKFGSVTENGTWMMAQDQNSPMVKWRNSLIDWIIRNNRNSLKMVVLFGGSAKDSMGTFIESKGAKVGTDFSAEQMALNKIRVPKFKVESAGSNNEAPALIDESGNDLYAQFIGKPMNYKKTKDKKDSPDVLAAEAYLVNNLNSVYGKLSFANSGLSGSGVMHPAQIGGYDLNKIEIAGKNTISIKGLPLNDGTKIKNDILIVELPHPTSLSNMTPQIAAATVERNLSKVKPYFKLGWSIPADQGMVNKFELQTPTPYAYRRSDIGPAYYDFGTPKLRMVSVSDAGRESQYVVVVGSRKKGVRFNQNAISAALESKRPSGIPNDEMFLARPRSLNQRYSFDSGPGQQMARIMIENLDMNLIGKKKNGSDPMTFPQKKLDGDEKFWDLSSEFNIKTHPVAVGDFGHFRGTFNNPKVIVLADPSGSDDILTSRALTGARGQYLHSLMKDMKIDDQYLIIKTVPFGMDGATDAEWATVLKQTQKYRSAIFSELLKNGNPNLVIADGKYASTEINNLVPSSLGIPTIKIARQGEDNESGIAVAAQEISKLPEFKGLNVNVRMENIPRSHLPFMSRVWEGTGGTHVFNSTDPTYAGWTFAIVAPKWASETPILQGQAEVQATKNLNLLMKKNKLTPTKVSGALLQSDDSGDQEEVSP